MKGLMEMSERADALQDNASQFEMSAGKLKNRNRISAWGSLFISRLERNNFIRS